MQRALPQIQQILRHEHEVYRSLLANAASDVTEILASNRLLEEHDVVDAAGFVPAYRELQSLRPSFTDAVMPGELMFKLYDTYGLRIEAIERLAEVEGLQLDRGGFEACLHQARARTKSTFAASAVAAAGDQNGEPWLSDLPYTENELKYNYRFNFATREYYSHKIRAKVLAFQRIHVGDDSLTFDVVLDQSTFYPEGGGQESDRGELLKERNKVVSSAQVEHVRMARGRVVVHRVTVPDENWLQVGELVELVQDSKRRTTCTLHHTATHLLNACVRHVTKSVCYQKSSSVTATGLKLELAVLGKKIDAEVVQQVQKMIEYVQNHPAHITTISNCRTSTYCMISPQIDHSYRHPSDGRSDRRRGLLHGRQYHSDPGRGVPGSQCAHNVRRASASRRCVTRTVLRNARAQYTRAGALLRDACAAHRAQCVRSVRGGRTGGNGVQ